MTGNIRSFVDYMQRTGRDKEVELCFLAFPEVARQYKSEHNLKTLSPLKLGDMIKVAQSDVVIANFGIQTLMLYARLTSLKFVDVWHGIPYKRLTSGLKFLNYYAEVWVSSPKLKSLYRKLYKIKAPMAVTGYARVDGIVNRSYTGALKKYALPTDKKIVLIAPTWKQDDNNRSIIPFGVDEKSFLDSLDMLAERTRSLIVFRSHRLSGLQSETSSNHKNIRFMPGDKYPNTEELLSVADILISDWSSLVFDYLPLQRPTIFLDVEPPFKHGFTLGPEYRFGEVVGSMQELLGSIEKYLANPNLFKKRYSKKMVQAEKAAYGATMDGRSCERYYARLEALLRRGEETKQASPARPHTGLDNA